MRDSICPKCGCKEIMSDVKILDRGHGNTEQDLTAAIYVNPYAMIFRGGATSPLTACVCSACGYTEFYAIKPQALLEAEQEKKAKKVKKS